jgi:hypothetical protein
MPGFKKKNLLGCLVSFEYPNKHYLLVAIKSLSRRSALNTPKPSSVLTAKNPEDRAGQLTGPPRPI